MNWFTSKILEAESSIKNVIGSQNLVKSTFPDEPVITAEMVEYVRNLCQHPKTFTDFPLDAKDKEGKTSTIFPLIHFRIVCITTMARKPRQDNIRTRS
jgi:hypothetical protein